MDCNVNVGIYLKQFMNVEEQYFDNLISGCRRLTCYVISSVCVLAQGGAEMYNCNPRSLYGMN